MRSFSGLLGAAGLSVVFAACGCTSVVRDFDRDVGGQGGDAGESRDANVGGSASPDGAKAGGVPQSGASSGGGGSGDHEGGAGAGGSGGGVAGGAGALVGADSSSDGGSAERRGAAGAGGADSGTSAKTGASGGGGVSGGAAGAGGAGTTEGAAGTGTGGVGAGGAGAGDAGTAQGTGGAGAGGAGTTGGAGGCAPETDQAFCVRLGKNCGTATGTDNCGTARTVSSCGTCTSPQICGTGSSANVCVMQPSCDGLAAVCGPSASNSCCASSVVPGGSFYRSYDNVTYTSTSSPATVSDFRLDTYEITVGRFRKFVAAYPGDRPAAGTGKNPNNASDSGWNATWNATMPPDQASLIAAVKCDPYFQTWTDSVGSNEARPMTCITWYEAFALCIWDGARLPTEAEWNYAAAGGNQQRAYPWSNPSTSTTIDDSYAVYNTALSPLNVGFKSPRGDARWGQADMAGNAWEWVLDEYSYIDYQGQCTNCSVPMVAGPVVRGGGFDTVPDAVLTSYRTSNDPTGRYNAGARCARNP